MAQKNHTGGKNHRAVQEKHWRDFGDQLGKLRDKERGLGINYEEMAEGLGVSRQRLSMFINNPSVGLVIDRANVLELWDYLTDPQVLDKKKLSQDARKKRDVLRVEGTSTLDSLLKAVGFLPTSQTVDKTAPQIERVRRRLSSPWISNGSVLSKITDNIIDTILDQGGLTKDEKKVEEYGYSAEEARSWPHKILDPQDVDSKTSENFDREITRFENLGKVRFYDNELFELYQSIFENYLLKDFDILVRVTDCQFRTLTFSLIDEFEKLDVYEDIKGRLSRVCIQCEKNLRSSNQSNNRISHTNNEFLRFPPVIEASVTLNFKGEYGDTKSRNVIYKYASSATHVENMLLALSNGMGYLLADTLAITGFFIRAIGRSSDSLARVSISLSERLQSRNVCQVYQGLWVEGNVIVGVLQAFLFASLNWLSEKINSRNIPRFFKTFEVVSILGQQLDDCIYKVYNYSYKHTYLTENETTDDLKSVEEEISRQAESIEALAKTSQFQNLINNKILKGYYETYKENLAIKRFLAILARTHASIVKSDVKQANTCLKELKLSLHMGDLQISSNENFTSVFVLHNAELMFYNLLCGEPDFIEDKEWRNPVSDLALDSAVQKLRDYIVNKKSGVIDIDIYLATAQLYGITGLVEFYVCQKDDIDHLEGAVDKFLSAAYYSAKIGHSQRAARALCHASRTCCRLGHREMAEQIIKVVYDLIDNPSKSQFSLAEGELLLRFGASESELYKAFFHFLNAWKNSMDQLSQNDNLEEKRFFRANIDSLYDIYRLFIRLGELNPQRSYVPFKEIYNFLEFNEGSNPPNKKENSDVDLLESFMNVYRFDIDTTPNTVTEKIQMQTILGWNSCCKQIGMQHPFSNWIRSGMFLEDCDKK